MPNQQDDLEYLEKLISDSLPDTLVNLPPEAIQEIKNYVEKVVHIKTKGVDKAFELTSVTIKFIPNFVLIPLIKSYIEPPIAARIAKVLTVKQILDIISQLSNEYVAESLLYMEEEAAFQVLKEMRSNRLFEIMRLVFQKQPIKVLDLGYYFPDSFLRNIIHCFNPDKYKGIHIHTEKRKATLERFIRFY